MILKAKVFGLKKQFRVLDNNDTITSGDLQYLRPNTDFVGKNVGDELTEDRVRDLIEKRAFLPVQNSIGDKVGDYPKRIFIQQLN